MNQMVKLYVYNKQKYRICLLLNPFFMSHKWIFFVVSHLGSKGYQYDKISERDIFVNTSKPMVQHLSLVRLHTDLAEGIAGDMHTHARSHQLVSLSGLQAEHMETSLVNVWGLRHG